MSAAGITDGAPLHLWLATNARLTAAPWPASTLQNCQTALALANVGHRVLLGVARLDGDPAEMIQSRLGQALPETLTIQMFKATGAAGEKKTPFASPVERVVNLQRARQTLGAPPDAIITRSPTALRQLRASRFIPSRTRLILEYQYPEWAMLWRSWRARNKNARLRECKERLRSWDRLEKKGVHCADGVMYAAHGHLALLNRYGYTGIGRTHWLASGCPAPEATTVEEAGSPEFDFGYVGSVAPENGLETMLEALTLTPRGQLLIIGGGDEKYLAQIKELVDSKNLCERVEFAGRVHFSEVRAAMRRCRIGVVPLSRRCGCEKRQYASPLKLIEWLAAGAAVIATSIPSVVQSVTDGEQALLIPPDDPHALAAAMTQLLETGELRSRLGRAGLQLAATQAHLKRAKRIAYFLRSLAAKP